MRTQQKPTPTTKITNYINHVAFVVDASLSMTRLTDQVIKVGDELVQFLAKISTEKDQETRITLYTFNDFVHNVTYDKDALRLPSLKDVYRADGNTALRDATFQAVTDLEKTAQLYGDHAFLVYVITDGEENRSYNVSTKNLRDKLNDLPDNWTLGVLVPDERGRSYAESCGFPRENITVWETSSTGLAKASDDILRSVTHYYDQRAVGVRGTKSLFSTDPDTLNKSTIKDAQLKPIPKGAYESFDVRDDDYLTIRDFVESKAYNYVTGCAFYQLTKTETIQPQKEIIVRNKKSGRYYSGPEARNLLGLPDVSVRVKPDFNPEFQVFVQSTSVNRRLVPGTKLLVFVS
jgi:hypothetical protein